MSMCIGGNTPEPTLPEEERLFSTTMNSQKVWVIEDGAALL